MAAAGAASDVYPETRYSAESLYGSRGFVRGWGRLGITLSFERPEQGVTYSGGSVSEKGSWRKL